MSYLSGRKASRRKAAFRGASTTGNYLPDYTSRLSGTRRHEYTAQEWNANLAANDYVPIEMLKFWRTGDRTLITPDAEPTPTSGNNFQTAGVMNGSRIVRFQKKIHISNNTRTPTTAANRQDHSLDIYQVALSFFDAQLWEDFESPAGQDALVNMTTSGNGAGEVAWENPNRTLTANAVKNSKFTQHYMQLLGRVTVEAGGSTTLNINRVPPKCRRANSGMFWGLVFHNESNLNSGDGVNWTISTETSFEEIPSDERPPFVY